MSAIVAIREAHAAGVRLGLDGDALTLEASAAPPTAVIELLARHKPDILALLRPAGGGWSGLDWLKFFGERACKAVAHGLTRVDAEARAFGYCIVEWLNRNPKRSSPERCSGCGQTEHSHDPLLPFGTDSTGHTWLHSHCWRAWHEARKADAIAALAAIGIQRPGTNQ